MSNPIVQCLESVLLAPTPDNLQQMGAAISAGATTLAVNTFQIITQVADLTAILAAPSPLVSLAWSGGVAVATTSAAIPGRTTGDVFRTTVAGASPSTYNGLVLATVTGTNSFTYPLAVNPGSETVPGTYTLPGSAELTAIATTFFAQSSGQAFYVLEIGASDGSTGPGLLQTWLQNNIPSPFYSFRVPKEWDGTAGFNTLVGNYSSPTSLLYFFIGTSVANYTNYTTKNVFAGVTSPGAPLTEDTPSSWWQASLSLRPSSANRLRPLTYTYLYGVTPYPAIYNGASTSATLTQLGNAFVNYVGTGAQGGQASSLILFKGRVMSGIQFMFWFGADWANINCTRNLTAAVINGNNDEANPLYYNQMGINTLQDVLVATCNTGISYGCLTGSTTQVSLDQNTFATNLEDGDYAGQNVVNAIPLPIYSAANPDDYGQGLYTGFTVACLPQVGFEHILFNLIATDIQTL